MAALSFAAAPALAQTGSDETVAITGRVFDAETGRAVPDATVTLLGAEQSDLTDGQGFFVFAVVDPGTYVLRVVHLAYGRHDETVEMGEEPIAVRVTVSPTAISLDPVVVETRSRDEAEQRGRGSRVNVLTQEEIVRYSRTSRHIGEVLRQAIPGVRVREGGTVSGGATCVEFRTAGTPRFAGGCRSPSVFVDGVRINDPVTALGGIPLSDLHRIEVVPPSEAGVLYGTESMFGVILIETKVWAESRAEEEILPPSLRGRALHDWSLEPGGHPWKRVYAASFAGNALGLLLGWAAARECIDFGEVSTDLLNSSCGGWGTAGARTALVTLPVLGASLGAWSTGGTDLSHGRFFHAVVSTAVVLIPAYALVGSSGEDLSGSRIAGQALLVFGLPAAATMADKLFRSIRGADTRP